MARLTPRVRSAGIASTTPTSIAPSVPHSERRQEREARVCRELCSDYPADASDRVLR